MITRSDARTDDRTLGARCHNRACAWSLTHYPTIIYGEAAAHTDECPGPVVVLEDEEVVIFYPERTRYRLARSTSRPGQRTGE